MKVNDYSENIIDVNRNIKQYPIYKYELSDEKQSIVRYIQDDICHEGPLEIRVKKLNQTSYESIAITMRTYGDDTLLATGFLFTEGLIEGFDQIVKIEQAGEDIIEIALKNDVQIDLETAKRKVYTSSSCGICSKGNLESLAYESQYLSWTSKQQFRSEILYGLSRVFKSQETIFAKTGGNHAVVLIDEEGNIKEMQEDVGRHNAMDKLIGKCLQSYSLPLSSYGIVLSGRISYELVQKAAMVGVPLIVALGAPSSMAIDEAQAQNICLVGFTKANSFNVYTSKERLK